MELVRDELLFYDVEVFAFDALVVFKDHNKKIKGIFHKGNAKVTLPLYQNGFDGLEDFIKGKTLVGYNNYSYDDHILTAMIEDRTTSYIKAINDTIIGGHRYYKQINPHIRSLDCFKQIDPQQPGLKKIEANRGVSIHETTVPFDIDRPLTSQELDEVIFYCSYDASETIEVYNIREDSYFKPKFMLINMLPEEEREGLLRRNTTYIGARLLMRDDKITTWNTPHLTAEPDSGNHAEWFKNDQLIYDSVELPEGVKEMWEQPFENRKTKKVVVKQSGAKYEFSFGGLHGVNDDKIRKFHNVILLDVRSLYPSIILILEALGFATERFKELVDMRIKVKHTDEVLQLALKLVINSVYGCLIDKYSPLYNPYAGQAVCMFGQISLFDLCERLHKEADCKLVNINTDGVGFTVPVGDDRYLKVAEEWQEKWGLVLEEEMFTTLIQRDVNNYVGLEPNGKVKAKGGDVSRYKNNAFFKENSNRIVDIAIVNKVLYDKSPLDSILESMDNPLLFQKILKTGRTYEGTCYRDTKEVLETKVNRVFATRDDNPKATYLLKKRPNGKTENFPNSPESMYIFNDDVKDFDNFTEIINIQYYLDLINDKLKKWL